MIKKKSVRIFYNMKIIHRMGKLYVLENLFLCMYNVYVGPYVFKYRPPNVGLILLFLNTVWRFLQC